MAIPPPPPGFVPVAPAAAAGRKRPPYRDLPPPPDGSVVDPLASIRSLGVTVTNGFRTPADTDRLRRQGYKPAANSLHLDGDAIDLTPPKGMGWGDLRRHASSIADSYGKGAKVIDESRTARPHVHLQLPGWGGAPGLPPPPDGFTLEQRGAIDGDTVRLNTGQNGRVQGVDAWELKQQGRRSDNALVSLGTDARNALASGLSPDMPVTATGRQTYGRPVVNLGEAGGDPAVALLRSGHALASPEYLEGDPRMPAYMEAERLARQNLLGGHGTNAETPEQFRHKDGPWQGAEPGEWGSGQAVFGDEPTPFQGLRPEIKKGYLAIWNDPKSKPDDLLAFAQANGFTLEPKQVRAKYAQRFKGGDTPDSEVEYAEPPRILTDVGDGAAGAAVRGFGDPINMIDELGGVADALGAPDFGGPRENIWNSNRRFGDILYNNIDQNRAILANDDAQHPMYRLGGQLASGVAMPVGGGIHTVPGLIRLGAAEGFLSGFGAGEGGPVERAPNALLGTAVGAAGGAVLGGVIKAAPVAWRAGRRIVGREGQAAGDNLGGAANEAAYEPPPIVGDEAQNIGPPPRTQPQGGVVGSAAMRMEDGGAELAGPVGRQRDRIDVSALPPPPEGYELVGPLARTRKMGEAASAEDMAQAAGRIEPGDVVPIPANRIESLDDATRANPGTLRDLSANEPPATAYEDLSTLGGRAGNIDLSRLETRGDIHRALRQTEALFGGFDAARRGTVSHAETAALADELGMRADDLLKRRQGQALNAEEALAARRILAKSGDELVGLAQRAVGGSEGDLATFRKAMLRHAAIQEQVTGATAEAGRALAQFKVVAKAKDHGGRIMSAILERAGGRDSIEGAAQAIIDLQKVPGALNRFALDAVKPTWKDKAVELWYNSLLSGPRTHAVNIMSNAITAGLQIPEHAAAAVIGGLRRGATDRVLLSELGPRVIGLMQGAEEGLRAFKHTLRTGNVPDHVTKVEAAQQEAIGGLKGKVLRTPTRLLSAEDEFFKAVARRSELAALAVRKARSEGLRGDKLTARIAELTANPEPGMIERALDYARYLTFQRPLGAFGQDVQRWTARTPVLKLFLPFVRTPTNLLKFALERSPAAPLLREVRSDFQAGGARRDLAIARMGMGSGLGLLVTGWAADGQITGGGPADRNRERLQRADGWQPYSVRVGDQYVSYQRLDPLASTLGVAADLVDLQSAMTDNQREHVGTLITASLIQNLANKTWLSGASDLAEAVGDPQRYGDRFLRRLAGSLTTPAASSQLAQTIDPTLREARSILDAVRARVPFASKALLPQRGVWGEEIRREGGLGPDILSPLPVSTRRNDPVTREAIDAGAVIGKPQRKDMSDREYNEFVRISGQLMKQAMQARIASPGWRSMTAEERRKAFDAEKMAARKAAQESLGSSLGLVGAGKKRAVPPPPPGFEPRPAFTRLKRLDR